MKKKKGGEGGRMRLIFLLKGEFLYSAGQEEGGRNVAGGTPTYRSARLKVDGGKSGKEKRRPIT